MYLGSEDSCNQGHAAPKCANSNVLSYEPRVLRQLTVDNAQCTISCSDEDFETAMVISTKLLLNAADAYNQIGGQDQLAVPEVKGCYQKETFLASLPEAFSTGECVKQAQVMGVSRRSTERWLQTWVETGILQKADYGMYAKLSA